MPTTITLTGFKEFEAKLKAMPGILIREIGGEVFASGQLWVDKAKNAAPVDVGFLTGQISMQRMAPMEINVTSHASYSAYMEWGTKRRTKVPADLSTYAAQFKGKGSGDYYEFLNAILDWVIRKGIANRYSIKTQKPIKINILKPGKGKVAKSDYERLHDTAAAIAFSIIRYGVNPHPFFFIQVPLVEKQLFTQVDKILKTEH